MRLTQLLLVLCFLLTLAGPAFALSPGAIKTIAPLQTVTPSHLTAIPNFVTTVKTTEPSLEDALGSITIESDPGGADIEFWVYGQKANSSAVTPFFSPMYPAIPYTIVLRKAGYHIYSQQVTLQPKQAYILSATLVPIDSPAVIQPTSPAPKNIPAANIPPYSSLVPPRVQTTTGSAETPTPVTGSLSVATNPAGATIGIDGIPAGASPATVPGLAEGTHNLTITMQGYAALITQVNIVGGQTMEYSTTLIPATEPTKPKAPGFEAAIAGAALAGIILLKRWA